MKLIPLTLFYFIFRQLNCLEIESTYAKIGAPFDISCKIQDPKLILGCWVENSMGSLKILSSGSNWERGRLKKLDNEELCGVHVTRAIRSDEGIWKCILAIGTKDKFVNNVTKIEVKIEQNLLHKLTIKNHMDPLLSKEKTISLQSVSFKPQIYRKLKTCNPYNVVG